MSAHLYTKTVYLIDVISGGSRIFSRGSAFPAHRGVQAHMADGGLWLGVKNFNVICCHLVQSGRSRFIAVNSQIMYMQ